MPKSPLKIHIPLSNAESEAKKMAGKIKGGEVIALIGELGSGKTTFTKALGKTLGIKHSIPSPTFVIMQEFPVPKTKVRKKLYLYHLDLYRVKSFKEVLSLGITEWWGHPETITVIEWADKIKTTQMPTDTTIIYLHRDVTLDKRKS